MRECKTGAMLHARILLVYRLGNITSQKLKELLALSLHVRGLKACRPEVDRKDLENLRRRAYYLI
jgi:hypothetical protein